MADETRLRVRNLRALKAVLQIPLGHEYHRLPQVMKWLWAVMAWIETHQELARHPKTRKAARLTGATVPAVIGHLHLLWWWCLDYADSGDLSAYDAEEIADAVLWEGEVGALIDALCGAGFLDCDSDGRRVHNWHKCSGKLIDWRRIDVER